MITPVGTGIKEDRRAKLRAAAARVRESLKPEFKLWISGSMVISCGFMAGLGVNAAG